VVRALLSTENLEVTNVLLLLLLLLLSVVLLFVHEGALMEIKIDQGVPLPVERGILGITLSALEVGDSFLAPGGYTTATVRRAASEAGKRLGRKFTVRVESMNDISGVPEPTGAGPWTVARVWRVA
jgi:hypothetical protein